MIGSIVGWLTSRAAKRLAGRLAELYLERESAGDSVTRARIDAEIRQTEARLEARQRAVESAAEVRQRSRAMELLTLLVGVPLGLHFAAVCFVSALPFWGWEVHALPSPMDEWQGMAIAAIFGVTGLLRAIGR